MSNQWVPEIYYEHDDGEGLTSHIPFIQVPENEEMPRILFIFESRDTGEFEPGLDGEELPIAEIQLRQYAEMEVLKRGLTPEQYDAVRAVLGLQPLQEATEAGKRITQNIRETVETREQIARTT